MFREHCMRHVTRKVLFTVLLSLSLQFLALAQDQGTQPMIIVEPATPGPGDIITVTVKNTAGPVTGKFGNNMLYFNSLHDGFKAVLGIDLFTEPGEYTLGITTQGTSTSHPLKVIKKEYPLQTLTLPNDMVELSPKNEARVEREQKKMSAIWPNESAKTWAGDFINPLEGEIITMFGVRRVMNDIPKRPHSGVDVAGGLGDKVRAPNAGVVTLVDNQFFGGRSLVLDHGQGIFTMYFHLSKVLVKKGQRVKKGDVIAKVGATGRATGPHLHWGVRMQGARVDPLELIHLKLE